MHPINLSLAMDLEWYFSVLKKHENSPQSVVHECRSSTAVNSFLWRPLSAVLHVLQGRRDGRAVPQRRLVDLPQQRQRLGAPAWLCLAQVTITVWEWFSWRKFWSNIHEGACRSFHQSICCEGSKLFLAKEAKRNGIWIEPIASAVFSPTRHGRKVNVIFTMLRVFHRKYSTMAMLPVVNGVRRAVLYGGKETGRQVITVRLHRSQQTVPRLLVSTDSCAHDQKRSAFCACQAWLGRIYFNKT